MVAINYGNNSLGWSLPGWAVDGNVLMLTPVPTTAALPALVTGEQLLQNLVVF